MPDVGVALAGIGGYGEFYVRGLLEGAASRGVRFVAAVDPAPERCLLRDALDAAGVPIFRGLEDLYARLTPDLLVLATPIPLHAPQATLALEQGSSVLCEKPLTATVGDACALRDAERRSGGRFLAVGFQWSFSEAVHALKADIRAGVFGRPLRLKTMVQWPRDSAYYGRNRWAGRVRAEDGAWVFDSPVSNATAHYLHNMFYMLGPETHRSTNLVSVTAELYRANPIESFDTAALRVETDAGAEVLFFTTHACPRMVGPLSVFEFENAAVTFAREEGVFRCRMADGREREYGRPDADPYRKLWLCTEAVRNGTPVSCGVEAVLPHVRCVNALHESADAIATVPSAMTGQRVADGGGVLTWIEGVGEVFSHCFDHAVLPHESGRAPWAVSKAAVVALSPGPLPGSDGSPRSAP